MCRFLTGCRGSVPDKDLRGGNAARLICPDRELGTAAKRAAKIALILCTI
jgi:hypothetical protein